SARSSRPPIRRRPRPASSPPRQPRRRSRKRDGPVWGALEPRPLPSAVVDSYFSLGRGFPPRSAPIRRRRRPRGWRLTVQAERPFGRTAPPDWPPASGGVFFVGACDRCRAARLSPLCWRNAMRRALMIAAVLSLLAGASATAQQTWRTDLNGRCRTPDGRTIRSDACKPQKTTVPDGVHHLYMR